MLAEWASRINKLTFIVFCIIPFVTLLTQTASYLHLKGSGEDRSNPHQHDYWGAKLILCHKLKPWASKRLRVNARDRTVV